MTENKSEVLGSEREGKSLSDRGEREAERGLVFQDD